MNILIIGNVNHQYNLSFAKSLKQSTNCTLTAICIKSQECNNPVYDHYYPIKGIEFIKKLKWIGSLYKALLILRCIKKYKLGSDAIILQSATPWISSISKSIKKLTKNYIVALWGSDFYRYKRKNLIKNIFNNTNRIIIGSPQMRDDFNSAYQNSFSSKIRLCYFGIEPIEYLKKIKETSFNRFASSKILNIDPQKTNIVVGHNGSANNQQLKVLDSLKNISKDLNEQINIILPMTYGGSKEFINEVQLKCKALSCSHNILTEFMSDEAVAHLRIISDIMINVQTTDAFSGSMREVMYCNGIVINGAWLPYNFIKKEGIYFEEVKSIDQISLKVNEIIKNIDTFKVNTIGNPERIYKLSSWSETIGAWIKAIKP
jgi:glycosyltransferase involved in cell wall biosynthesis